MNAKAPAAAYATPDAARKALTKVRDNLATATAAAALRTAELRALIVEVRPAGLLTVDEMGQAVGRDRNYIDSVWSDHGTTTKGRQTRIPVAQDTPADAARFAYDRLKASAKTAARAADAEAAAREERNRVVAEVYGSKLIGPTEIARHVNVDRNHVLRIARKAGVRPMHRTGSKNQYTKNA